jgi:glycosyltransferase involved in cell wall biosynthesis
MKIALFSMEDNIGGASRATSRLFTGLKNLKLDVSYNVKISNTTSIDNTIVSCNENKANLYENIINNTYINNNRTQISSTFFSFTYSSYDIKEIIKKSDIINLHWIEHFLSLENLEEIVNSGKPIIWTLHDMKPFTGGCHYNSGCSCFMSNCENCIQLTNDVKKLPNRVLKLKQEIFKNANITIVSPSKWLAEEANRSTLFQKHNIKVIANAIDCDKYKPINKDEAKTFFNIETYDVVLLFASQDNKEKRKGYDKLVEALEIVTNNLIELKIVALLFGAEHKNDLPIETKYIGYITDDVQISYVYSAADIFILPSLEDNLPNTMLESLSCATPVIAFKTGGISDVVNKGNGIIVDKGNTVELAEAILKLAKDKKLRVNLGKNGRQLIESNYNLKIQATRYYDLFKSLKQHGETFNLRDINSYFDDILGYCFRKHTKNNKLIKNEAQIINCISSDLI